MGKICELSQHVANQIAAGEVVERPASVIKELLENALDADAKNIEVRIKDGGFSHIIVTDDGEGMEEEDVRLAVKRYATSKLATVSDLNSLKTFGFRGEALPSIASISLMTINTKTASQEIGVKAILDAGTMRDVYRAQTAKGTRVEVRDLFFNVPARLKFARSKRAEAGEIDRLLRAFAFVRPDIGWKFFSDNDLVFSFKSEDEAPMQRAIALLGKDTEGHLFNLKSSTDIITVSGVVSSPFSIRKDTRNMVFYVNGRLVSDKKLVMAVKTAFRSLLEIGRSPVCALDIHIAPDQVDVNVHPRKAEVRFSDERRVISHLISMIGEFLSKTPWLEGAPKPATPFSVSGFYPPQRRESFDYLLAPPTNDGSFSFLEKNEGHRAPIAMLSAPRFSELKVVGQIRSTYIVTESEHGLVIIDQHAAHERIMYERFLEKTAQCVSSPFLIPISVPLSITEMAALEEFREELLEWGFEIEVFGKDLALIRSLPIFFEKSSAQSLLKDILNDCTEWGRAKAAEDLYAHVCATLACHAAIRAGQKLGVEEITALLNELDDTDFHAHCPHGRPIVKSFGDSELKRWFDRT